MNMFDIRFSAIVISVWSVIIVALMLSLGFFDGPFFHLGPSKNALFFGKPIDNWSKYCGIVVYIIIQQVISTYGLETISPWMINQVQNRNVKQMRESHTEIMSIMMCWYTYMWISRVVSIQLLLSQIDFLAIVLLVDLGTTFFVTRNYYLKSKITGVASTTTENNDKFRNSNEKQSNQNDVPSIGGQIIINDASQNTNVNNNNNTNVINDQQQSSQTINVNRILLANQRLATSPTLVGSIKDYF